MPIPAPETLIDRVMAGLGMAVADVRRSKVGVAVTFMTQCAGIDDPAAVVSHLRGIDFHSPLGRTDLLPGTQVVGYRWNPDSAGDPINPFGDYFTGVGREKNRLGVNPADRRFLRFEVRQRAVALESRTAAGRLPDMRGGKKVGDVVVFGGGIQYFIPRSSQVLRLTHVQHAIRAG